MLRIEQHPVLEPFVFKTTFSKSICGFASHQLDPLRRLNPESAAPLQPSDMVRKAVRDLLRHGGFKPTGRNKPASEYLIKAASESQLPEINIAVDTCNVVSLHSGLPISVVDFDQLSGKLHIAVAPEASEYVFNLSGQVLKLDGLLCLFDELGPCANAVKDSQRTKTSDETTTTLTVIWGTTDLPGRASEAGQWYQSLLAAADSDVQIETFNNPEAG